MFNSDLENNDKLSNNSRRSFLRNGLLSGTAVLGGIALWGKLGTRPVEADAKQEMPGMVTIVNFSNDGKKLGKVQVAKVIKTDAEWRQQLPHNSYEIARQADTEMAYTGATWNLHDKGLFRCICCDTALFSSNTKFDSGTGWPSFWAPLAKENIVEKTDSTLGMERTEVKCRLCDAHLGHVFDDGPQPTGLRYCMNSGAMKFEKA
jgi:peptide-methionine (R)-S-oxide reductase